MSINVGSLDILSAYVGSEEVREIYIGSTKVWPDSPSTVYAGNYDGVLHSEFPNLAALLPQYWELEFEVLFHDTGEHQRFVNFGGDGVNEIGIELFYNVNTGEFWCSWTTATDNQRSEVAAPAYDTRLKINVKRVDTVAEIWFNDVEQTYDTQDAAPSGDAMDYGSDPLIIGYTPRQSDDVFDGLMYSFKVFELNQAGERVSEVIHIDYQNGPDGVTEPNKGADAPADSDMTWMNVTNPGDQYVEV